MTQPDIARLKIQRSAKVPNRRGSSPGLWRYGLVLGAILAGFLLYRAWSGRVMDVRVGNVVSLFPSQIYTRLTATGYVVPQTKADVASKATGRLERLEVAEGDRVKKGDILARIENQDVMASLTRAEADILAAKTTLDGRLADLKEADLALARAEVLVSKHFLSNAALEVEQARRDRAKAAVANAQALIHSATASRDGLRINLEYTLIRAPFDGVILSKHADVGDMLAPFASAGLSKASVVSMADLNTLEVEADVSESNLLKVSMGQACEVQLDALPDERFACQVGSIVPTLDKSKATVLVKTRFMQKDSRFLPDMSARVAFLAQALAKGQETARLAVPTKAIQTLAGEHRIFRLVGETISPIIVQPGEQLGEYTAVDPVVTVGEALVLDPPPNLAAGAAVRVLKP